MNDSSDSSSRNVRKVKLSCFFPPIYISITAVENYKNTRKEEEEYSKNTIETTSLYIKEWVISSSDDAQRLK